MPTNLNNIPFEDRLRMAQEAARKQGVSEQAIEQLTQKAISANQTTTQKSRKKDSGNLLDVAKGALKGAQSTVSNIGSMGQKALDKIAEPVVETITGKEYQATPNINETLGDKLDPVNTAEKIGYGTEQIAEFFVPGGATAKVGKAMKAAGTVSKVAARGAIEAATAAGVTLAQTEDVKTAGTNAIIAGAFPFIGKIAEIGTKPVKEFLAERVAPAILNKYIIKPGANAFKFGKDPGLGVAKEGLKANTREGLLKQIISKKDQIGKEIDSVLSPIKEKVIDVRLALKSLDEDILKASESGEEALYNRLVKVRDGITSKFQVIEGKAVKVADKSLNLTPLEAARLKREIGNASKWTGQAFDNETNQARVKVYGILNDLIDQAAPGSKKLNARWANMLTAEKALQHTVDVVKKQSIAGLINGGAGAATGVASFVSGDSAPEAIAKSLAVTLGLKGLQSTAVQSRLAAHFAKLTDQEKSALAKLVPTLKNIILGQNSFDSQNDE